MFTDIHRCLQMFYSVCYLLITLKGGQHLTEGRLDNDSLSSARCEAKQHKNSKATQCHIVSHRYVQKIGNGRQTGDKQETNSTPLRLSRCSEPENMLFARTCYLAAHTHITLAIHTSNQENETLDVGTCWHTGVLFALCFA